MHVVRGEAEAIDMDRRVVNLAGTASGDQPEIPFDHLVLALGAVPNFYGLPGLEENAFTFKTLKAAIDLRNHVIDMLEMADDEPEPREAQGPAHFCGRRRRVRGERSWSGR